MVPSSHCPAQTANTRRATEKASELQRSIDFCSTGYTKAFMWITTSCGKLLQEMGIPDRLTCFLRNLYAGQEATVRTRHGTMDCFQIGKGVYQGCILSPCLFNLNAEYIMWNAELDEAQAGIKIAGGNINNLRYVDDNTLWQKAKRNLRASWWKWKGKWKSWLKTQHSKNKDHGICFHHFMANRWENNGQWQTLISWAPKSLLMVKDRDA